MALHDFNILVTNIHLIPNEAIANVAEFQGTTNIVCGLDVTAIGHKENTEGTVIILNVPISYNVDSNNDGFISFDELHHNDVSGWAANSLIQIRGTSAIEDLQMEVEKEIDKKLAHANPLTPNLPWNKSPI